MKKIPTLFKRDFNNNGQIIPEYVDGVEWVIDGEGTATRKYDGTSVMIRDGVMYKRYELKPGKVAPYGFEAVDSDPETGKTMGWVECGNGNEDKWHREGLSETISQYGNTTPPDGTYELVGPKVQGNPEHKDKHMLVKHSNAEKFDDAPVEFEALKQWLTNKDIEGIVWHHPDGRMAKIKKKDYRLKR